MNDKCKLPPEVEEGNIEYKRQLCSLSRYRFQQLQSQMKWRVDEGRGTAIYLIGVDDDGTIVKLSTKNKKESLKNVKKIAAKIDCYIDNITYKDFYYEIVIKKNIKLLDFVEKRIVFFGNSEVGKSTLISVLCGNDYDNGEGSARLSLFNHKHEMFTGYTSSISIQTFNIDKKKIALIDLPGKTKYKKTKYYGLLSYDPEVAIIVIDYKTTSKSIDHTYQILKFLKIPIKFVQTKVDINSNLKKINYPEIEELIKVSSINGLNINALKNNISEDFNYSLQKKNDNYELDCKLSELLLDDSVIFQICEVYYLTDIGLIVSGILLTGEIETEMKMKLGPIKENDNLKYYEVIINSIHCYQTPYNKLNQDHIGTVVIKFKNNKINIKEVYNKISKNSYLTNHNLDLKFELNAKIRILSESVIKKGIKLNLFLRNIIIDCEIILVKSSNDSEFDIDCKILLSKSVFVRKYDKFIFDHNNFKGYGLFY